MKKTTVVIGTLIGIWWAGSVGSLLVGSLMIDAIDATYRLGFKVIDVGQLSLVAATIAILCFAAFLALTACIEFVLKGNPNEHD